MMASGLISLIANITQGSNGRDTIVRAESGAVINSPACSRPRARVREVIPYVNDPQYRVVADRPASNNGEETVMSFSMLSNMNNPMLVEGYLMMYLNWHWGQLTDVLEDIFCFSSTQCWIHIWWTYLVPPLHLQGLVHSAPGSSSSVPKHTQHCLTL